MVPPLQNQQPLFGLGQLRELVLAKAAHLFLGEAALGDGALSAAARLGGLTRLSLSTVRLGDDGFACLAALGQLRVLDLAGQLNVTLSCLAGVAAALPELEELRLGLLAPSNSDLRRVAAAHAAAQQTARLQLLPGGTMARRSSGSGGGSPAFAGSRRRSGGSSDGGAAGASSCSGSRGKFASDDWSCTLLPLKRLRRLHLTSDLALLGSCAALRSMASLTHVELHAGAKFLSAGPAGALPPSWLSLLSGASSTAELVSAGGAWPALRSLQVRARSMRHADACGCCLADCLLQPPLLHVLTGQPGTAWLLAAD